MSIKKDKKGQIIQTVKDIYKNSKSLVFFDYQNISTISLTGLRDKLFENKAKFSVFKNTLLKKALGNKVPEDLEGPTAVLFCEGDPVAPVKDLYGFKKENENVNIKFGILDGAVISQNQVDVLATLPSKDALIAQVLRGFSSPIRGFVGVLSGVQRSLVSVLSQIARAKS